MGSGAGKAFDQAIAPGRLGDPPRLAQLGATGLLTDGEYPTLDRLTRTAAEQTHAPMSLVTLITADRQVFASHFGLGEPWAARGGAPLSHSFSQHVVTDDAPLVVTDARLSDRLRGNRAIGELGVIAYAGFPLHSPDGAVLGAFAVLDHRPRVWTAGELALVRALAGAAEAEIALRLANRELRQTAERMGAILDTAQDGFVSIDGQGVITGWNAAAVRLFGYPAVEATGRQVAELIIPSGSRPVMRRVWPGYAPAGRPPWPVCGWSWSRRTVPAGSFRSR